MRKRKYSFLRELGIICIVIVLAIGTGFLIVGFQIMFNIPLH